MAPLPTFHPPCEIGCGREATVIAQGCMDKQPVVMCKPCYDRGVEVITTYIHIWMQTNKKVMICGDCHRPIIDLETHVSVKEFNFQ